MLDGIKSKLGFADANDQEPYDQEPYDEGYGDYGEYGDDGEGYDEYADYGPGYDENAHSGRYDSYAPVTTRSAGVGSARGARGSRTEPALPKLVSIDDVRAHTQLPDSLTRDPLPPRRVQLRLRFGISGRAHHGGLGVAAVLDAGGNRRAAAAARPPAATVRRG